MNRSEVRHALYRAKNGVPSADKQDIYDIVEPMIPKGETWSDFSVKWDIFVIDGTISMVRPEVDYDFIHSTCIEKSMHVKNKIPMETTQRQDNTIQIVELNMLEGKMAWETYNKTWGVSVDKELKRVYTRLFLTNVNVVSDEMIKQSAPSDGNAMSEVPSIPTVTLDEPEIISKDEFDRMTAPKKRGKTK